MTSQPGKNNCNTNIPRTKGNQAMKIGQLIECNMKNIFLKSYTQDVVQKLFLRPYSKNSKLRISQNQLPKAL